MCQKLGVGMRHISLWRCHNNVFNDLNIFLLNELGLFTWHARREECCYKWRMATFYRGFLLWLALLFSLCSTRLSYMRLSSFEAMQTPSDCLHLFQPIIDCTLWKKVDQCNSITSYVNGTNGLWRLRGFAYAHESLQPVRYLLYCHHTIVFLFNLLILISSLLQGRGPDSLQQQIDALGHERQHLDNDVHFQNVNVFAHTDKRRI